MATYITLDNLAEFLNQLVEKKLDPMQADINEKLDSDENAVSASKLHTARTIALEGDATGSVSFDGSSNVTITVTVTDGSHTHTISNISNLGSGWATALASTLSATVAELNYLSGVTSNVQTQLNNKLGSSDNAVSATKLATARTITLSGDASGSASFDGSANVTISVTVADDSHSHTVSTISNLGSGWSTALTTALTATITEINYLSGVTSNIQTQLNNKLSTSGTASSASRLATARTITLSGDVTGSASFDGSANVTITTSLANSNSATLSRTSTTYTTTSSGTQTYTLSGYTTSKLLDVYLNGFKLIQGTEYTISGTTFTTVNSIESGQVFEFVITEIA